MKRFNLSFNHEDIKNTYIYPFNYTKNKRDNIATINKHISTMADKSEIYYLPKLQTDPNLIYEQKKF